MQTSVHEMQWVLRAQCHDREALEALLAGVQPALRRYLTGVVGATDADDLLQDALVIIATKIGGLVEPSLFRPWCFRITSRLAFRHVKKRRAWLHRHQDDVILEAFPVQQVAPSDDALRELRATDAVSPASRAVLILHYQEEIPLPEVAAILEIPVGTAKSRLAYGLKALRLALQTPGGSHG